MHFKLVDQLLRWCGCGFVRVVGAVVGRWTQKEAACPHRQQRDRTCTLAQSTDHIGPSHLPIPPHSEEKEWHLAANLNLKIETSSLAATVIQEDLSVTS